MIYFRKAAAGLDHAHHEEDHQQGVADGLEAVVDIENDGPDPAALEFFRAGREQGPYFRQPDVPGSQGGVQVVYNPVSTSDCYYPFLF